MDIRKVPFLFAITWAGLILYFSIKIAPGAGVIGDKSLHMLAFFVLTALIYFSIHKNKCAVPNAVLVALVYGIMIELVQLGVPGRVASLSDVMANIIGSAVVIAVHESKHELENLAKR